MTNPILIQHLQHLAQAFQAGDGAGFARALVLSGRDEGWDRLRVVVKTTPILPTPAQISPIVSPSPTRPCPPLLLTFLTNYLTFLHSTTFHSDAELTAYTQLDTSSNDDSTQRLRKEMILRAKESVQRDWRAVDALWDQAVKVFLSPVSGVATGTEDGGAWMGRTVVRLAEVLLHAAFRASRITQDARSTAPSNSVDKVRRIFQASAGAAEYSQNPGEHGKKGDPAFALGNICWRVYDQLHTYRLLDTISQTYAQMKPSTDERLLAPSTTKAERVGYWYWCGKLRLAKGQVREASEYLDRAFGECPVGAGKNLRAIFIRLATCQILLGRFPSSWLLSQFDSTSTHPSRIRLSDRLVPLMRAIQSGDRAGYREHLQIHGEWFRRRGLWLVLRDKGDLLVWRGLFRNVFSIWRETNGEKSSRCPIGPLLCAAQLSFSQCGEEEGGLEDVISILASLIDQSYIKGYISNTHSTLVMAASATDPYAGFPAPAHVRPRTIQA